MVVCSVDNIVDTIDVVPVDSRLQCGGVPADNTGITGPPMSSTVTVGDTKRLFMPYCEPSNVSDSSNEIISGGSVGLRAKQVKRGGLLSPVLLCLAISVRWSYLILLDAKGR